MVLEYQVPVQVALQMTTTCTLQLNGASIEGSEDCHVPYKNWSWYNVASHDGTNSILFLAFRDFIWLSLYGFLKIERLEWSRFDRPMELLAVELFEEQWNKKNWFEEVIIPQTFYYYCVNTTLWILKMYQM